MGSATPTDRESKVKKTVRERQLKSEEKGKEAVEIGHVKKGPLERKRMYSLIVLQTKCLHLSINK